MKYVLILLASFFVLHVSADEVVSFKVDLSVYSCDAGSECGGWQQPGLPISVVLAPVRPGSDVLAGIYEAQKLENDLIFQTTIQVVKIPSGPDAGYLAQVFLTIAKKDVSEYLVYKQLGNVFVDDFSKLNRLNFKYAFSTDEKKYNTVVTLVPN